MKVIRKRVPHEFSEGQKIEQRAVKKFKPAFARAVRIVIAEIDAFLDSNDEPTFGDVTILANQLPWGEFRDELVLGWIPIAEKVIFQAGELAAADNPRVLKIGASPAQLISFATQWANTHALLMAEATTLGSELAVREMLIMAVNQNLAPLEVAKSLRAMVGITSGDVTALGNLRLKLEKLGFSSSRVTKKLKTKANQMRRRRAENIARTEINGARNRGTLESWKLSHGVGDIPHDTHKMWVASGGCIVCENIVANGPVPLREPFQSSLGPAMHPPAHPSCRCSMALTFPSDGG